MKFVIFDNQLSSKDWDAFVGSHASDGGVLQSFLWGNFRAELEPNIWRVGVVDEKGEVLSVALVMKQKFARLFHCLSIPRGPILNKEVLKSYSEKEVVLDILKSGLDELAKKEKVIFLRMEPSWTYGAEEEKWLKSHFKKSPRSLQPQHTIVTPLNQSLEDLMSNMKSKTRYNINLSARRGVTVRLSHDKEDLGLFWNLLKKTEERKKIQFYNKNYFEAFHRVLIQEKKAFFVIAEYDNQPAAVALILLFGNRAYYAYGASDYKYRQVMAPFLLHWFVIKHLKQKKIEFYDWWGMPGVTHNSRESSWQGFARFKRGFSPRVPIIEYLGTWEFAYRKNWYKILNWLR